MQNNKNNSVFNETHLQNIKSKIEEKTGVQLNSNNENAAFKPVRILRRPAAIIALMICFVMLVSATAVIIYQTQYIPGKGFVESGEYEVYYTPEILKLGKCATVETVTRVKYGRTSDLTIIITDTLDQNIKIITKKHGEFNLTPAIDYDYSSFGTMGQYQFNKEGSYSSYGYFIKDFPNINEFTLVNNGESIEVKLVNNPADVLTAEDSDVTVRFYKMSKGSKVLAYEMHDNIFDVEKILGTSVYRVGKNLELGFWANGAYQVYDENGKEVRYNGLETRGGANGSTTMFLRIGRETRISRIEINSIMVSVDMFAFMNDSVDIPIPKDGEELILDDGLMLYDCNGLTSELTSVERKGNEVTIYTNTKYTGKDINNIENIDAIHMWFKGELGANMFGPGFNVVYINGDNDFIKIRPDSVRFIINGNWEVKFAD